MLEWVPRQSPDVMDWEDVYLGPLSGHMPLIVDLSTVPELYAVHIEKISPLYVRFTPFLYI